MKNLVFVAAGDQSLHHQWADGENRNFEVMIAYYGRGEGPITGYRQCHLKGTKFKILHQAYEQNPDFDEFDAILVMDDDLFISTGDINKFFDIFHQYKLWLAQPSVLGWWSLLETLPVPGNILRFTNWVEIMCPCFGKGILKQCSSTFLENKSDWGIENIWRKLLNDPKDKIAIIDSVSVVHTRPCFFGDTYHINNNTFESAYSDFRDVISKHNIVHDIIIHGQVKVAEQEFSILPSELRFFPQVESLKKKVSSLRQKTLFMV